MIYQHYRRITRNKIQPFCRNLTQRYSGLFLLVLVWFLFARTTVMESPDMLPCQGWFPYNYSRPAVYTITAVYQLCAICNAAVTNLAFDPLLPCIFYYICAHIKILKLRFNTLLKKLENFDVNNNDTLVNKLQIEEKLISEWVNYHIDILSWADMINVTFSKVVMVQYSSSSFILCALAYLTSHTPIGSVDFIRNLTFLLVMYIQIYVQCVAADRMTVEFADIAIEIGTAKWFNLSYSAQKYVVIILAKSMKPVVFTCGFFLSLSLESFMKMTILERNFFFLSLVGLWKPVHFEGWKSICYLIYHLIVLFTLLLFLASGFMAIMTTAFELHSFIDNVSLLLSLVTGGMKIGCLIFSRSSLIKIEERLEKRLLKPEDHEEQMIYERYVQMTRYIFKYYPMVFIVAITWYSIAHIAIMDPPNVLPYVGWFPYNYSTRSIYWLTACNQLYAICNAATTNLSFDPLLPCMLCYICAHVNVLKHRFNTILKKVEKIADDDGFFKLDTERKLIGDWVEYHIEILSLVEFINSVFTNVIFVQYFGSAFQLCTIAYLLSHSSVKSMAFLGNLSYFLAMNFQIFFQCVNANRMTVEFSDMSEEIGTTNWFSLSNSGQKCMVIILAKSMRPIIFTSGFFLTLSLESFTKVIKLSYTVYNVLE
ncbi:odorant receptor 2a-like [Chelonus insularis]|uniref:odorant receptor 2a-like n=1 Tax=Chelonus insularis TaxID=460826 RepID=UPI00158ABB11|nr:odorant receptor 2a-like [Chelonus insularis]